MAVNSKEKPISEKWFSNVSREFGGIHHSVEAWIMMVRVRHYQALNKRYGVKSLSWIKEKSSSYRKAKI